MCQEIGVEHPDHLTLDSRQHADWREFWELEPWGDVREDWRQAAYYLRPLLLAMEKTAPDLTWPYFPPDADDDIDPEELIASAQRTENDIEPKPGGGYQWTAAALERRRAHGNDDRET